MNGSPCRFRLQDNAVRTARGPVRVPTVIVAVNYARVAASWYAEGAGDQDQGYCAKSTAEAPEKDGADDQNGQNGATK